MKLYIDSLNKVHFDNDLLSTDIDMNRELTVNEIMAAVNARSQELSG